MPKLRHPQRSGLHIRLVLDGKLVMGPGRAELLERVRVDGSISAAGRRMNMSYKRAWELVEAMNTMFQEPVIRAERGGQAGGGARLTATGDAVLAAYRRIEAAARLGAVTEIETLRAMLRPPGDVRTQC